MVGRPRPEPVFLKLRGGFSSAWPADPFRILLVVDNDEIARGVAASLGAEFAGGLRTCMKPDQAKPQSRSHRAHQRLAVALSALREGLDP